MRLSKNISIKIVGLLLSLYFTPVANAQTATPTPAPTTQKHFHHRGHFFKKCKTELFPNVAKGQLTADQKQQVFACVQQKVAAKKALKAQCAQSLGITLPAKGSGQRLTKDQRQSLHACMKQASAATPAPTVTN